MAAINQCEISMAKESQAKLSKISIEMANGHRRTNVQWPAKAGSGWQRMAGIMAASSVKMAAKAESVIANQWHQSSAAGSERKA